MRLWDRDKGGMLVTLSTTLVPQHNRCVGLHQLLAFLCSETPRCLRSHINCLIFDAEGKKLYSGDGAGDVKVWNCPNTGADRHTSFSHQHTIAGQRAVNSLRLNPRGSRLVVHTRNNLLRTIETKSFVEYKQYSGLRNERLMIRSDVSPDGRYIVSGSEDGQVYADPSRPDPHYHPSHAVFCRSLTQAHHAPCRCIWKMESGEFVSAKRPSLGYMQGHATYDVRWNPTDNMIAVCTYGQPQPVMLWRHGALPKRIGDAPVEAPSPNK